MNSLQNSTLASYGLIVTEAKNEPETVSLIPKFQKGITRLGEIKVEIEDLAVQQTKDLKGITDDKKDSLDELSASLIDVAGAVHSYANGKGDKILLAKVDYKTNRVHTMKQADIIYASGIVLEEAVKVPAEALADEGITPEEMASFTSEYNYFKGITSSKREATIDRTGYTDRIAELFAEAAELKKNTLDRLATQFIRKAPQFYNKYKAAATVLHKHTSKPAAPAEGKM
jgi:hypothetical protein